MDCLKTGIILSVGQVWVGWKCGLRHLLNLDTHKIGATITFTLFCVSYNTILLQTRLYLNVFYLDPIFQPFKTWPYLSVFSHFLSLSLYISFLDPERLAKGIFMYVANFAKFNFLKKFNFAKICGHTDGWKKSDF